MGTSETLPVSESPTRTAEADDRRATKASQRSDPLEGAEQVERVMSSPLFYQRNQSAVVQALKLGKIEYASFTHWQFPDEFFCFLYETEFFRFVENTYPNPRFINWVPVWFLSCCQILLSLHPMVMISSHTGGDQHTKSPRPRSWVLKSLTKLN